MLKDARTGLLTTNSGGDVVLRRVLVRVVSGESRGSEGVLEQGTMVLGTHPTADLQITDHTVSRFHVELGLLSDGVRVRDLGSTNGTFVGDSRIESVVVHPLVEIKVGRTRVELVPADMPAPDAPPEVTRFGSLVGESAAMRRVFGVLERAASATAPLLIEGETGTGKSEAAQAVHDASERTGPCVVWEPGEDLTQKAQQAEHGTLILDRLDALSRAAAASLVSMLDRRERGELDVRPIGLSRVDLRTRVEEGALRRDLYFHLAAIRVVVPPLRERREDLPVLIAELAGRLGRPGLGLSPEDLTPLASHAFEGNVRELARLVEQLLATMLPRRPSDPPPIPAAALPAGAAADVSGLSFKQAKERLVDAFERRYVAALLERHEGNLSRAAADAGLDRNYLARLAKKHGLR